MRVFNTFTDKNLDLVMRDLEYIVFGSRVVQTEVGVAFTPILMEIQAGWIKIESYGRHQHYQLHRRAAHEEIERIVDLLHGMDLELYTFRANGYCKVKDMYTYEKMASMVKITTSPLLFWMAQFGTQDDTTSEDSKYISEQFKTLEMTALRALASITYLSRFIWNKQEIGLHKK